MKYYWVEKTEYGFVSAMEEDDTLIRVFLPRKKEIMIFEPDYEKRRTPLLKEFLRVVRLYFDSGKFCYFSIYPIRLPFSPFRRMVYTFLKENVGWGTVLTYKEVAEGIGSPFSFRAVGNALSLNETPLVIPCHRVISKNGPGGFTGGINLKRIMLRIEGVKI